jgi:predicted MFS family arabinose efflux permease
LAFANVCSFADRQLTSILAAPIRTTLGLDHTSMALLGGTAFATFYGLGGLPAGLAADRFRRKALICGAILFWSICTALCGLADGFWPLFGARMGVGIGEAALLPCAFSLIRDLTPPGRRGLAFAVFGLGIPVGSAAGLIIGGWLNTALHQHPQIVGGLAGLQPWQKTFLFLAALGLPTAAAAAFLPDPPRVREPRTAQQPRRGGSMRTAAVYFLAVAGFGVLVQGVAFWSPTLLMARFGLSTAAVGLRIGLITIVASCMGMFILGQASDGLARRLGASGVALTLALTAALFVPAVSLLVSPSAAAWAGVAGFYFLAIGGTTVASDLALRVGPADRAGLMGALYGSVVNLAGQGMGPLLFGWLKDRAPSASLGVIVFWAAAAVALVAACAALATAALARRGPMIGSAAAKAA